MLPTFTPLYTWPVAAWRSHACQVGSLGKLQTGFSQDGFQMGFQYMKLSEYSSWQLIVPILLRESQPLTSPEWHIPDFTALSLWPIIFQTIVHEIWICSWQNTNWLHLVVCSSSVPTAPAFRDILRLVNGTWPQMKRKRNTTYTRHLAWAEPPPLHSRPNF